MVKSETADFRYSDRDNSVSVGRFVLRAAVHGLGKFFCFNAEQFSGRLEAPRSGRKKRLHCGERWRHALRTRQSRRREVVGQWQRGRPAGKMES